ncbi:MAG: hypothetical protein WCR17_04505 [Candidatus Methanomethylophilaceae archaeon]
MNYLQKSAEYIKKMRAKATEVDITLNDVDCKATVGSTLFKSSGNFAGGIYERSVDFLIAVDALDAMPTTDDVITWNDKNFAIVSYNGEPPVRYSDPLETTYRIHCKEVGGE